MTMTMTMTMSNHRGAGAAPYARTGTPDQLLKDLNEELLTV
jgi:hypothetical protein